ncbi:MAG: rod shape-determining protein MreC [Clostridia bacterium]|nr:rod shape-determining protein MreC [Clostridia bacterium]
MDFLTKKWKIIITVTAAIAVLGFVSEYALGFNPIEVVVNSVMAPIKTGFSYVVGRVEDGVDFIIEMRAYKADNERLEAENLELKRANREISVYREENTRLNELLALQTSMEDYNTVAARVISYSGSNWCEEVEISKGSASGINVGNVVITANGVVGRVKEAGLDYAVVTTILDSSSAVGIKVSRTGGTGLVEGDKELAAKAQCSLSFLDRNTTLIVGDIVETSGSGGLYPAGLVVGNVVSISADNSGALNYAVIEPAVDMENIGEVLVICE